MQMTIRQKESEQVAPYPVSFQQYDPDRCSPGHTVRAQTFALSHMQMTIRQKESEQVAPYSASFQRTMISAILKAEDGGVSQVGSCRCPHALCQPGHRKAGLGMQEDAPETRGSKTS